VPRVPIARAAVGTAVHRTTHKRERVHMATIKIGIVGTGNMARAHANHFTRIAGCRVVAVHDVDHQRAEAFATERGIPTVCTSLEQLIDACDAVSVVVPDRFHAELSIRILKAGRHLLCEKPLTVTLAEARRVVRAWRAAGTVGLVNFSHRTGPDFVEAQRLVADGAVGEPRLVRSHYLQGWLGDAGREQWKNPARLWRLQRGAGSGGVLGDLGCHILDFTTGIAGDPKRLRCTFRTHPKLDAQGRDVTSHRGKLDANDTATVELDLTNGAYARSETTRWATGYGNHIELEIHGTHGAIACGHAQHGPWVRLYRSSGRKAREWVDAPRRKRYPDNWQRFITAIKRRSDVEPDILRGAQIQSLLDACERSAASGEWVKPRTIR